MTRPFNNASDSDMWTFNFDDERIPVECRKMLSALRSDSLRYMAAGMYEEALKCFMVERHGEIILTKIDWENNPKVEKSIDLIRQAAKWYRPFRCLISADEAPTELWGHKVVKFGKVFESRKGDMVRYAYFRADGERI